MRMFQRAAFGAALFLSGSALATGAFAADNIAADLDQPLWYQAPSAKTLELAKIDDLSSTVVSDGQRGEKGVLGSSIQLTPEQIDKVKAGKFKVAISLGWLGDDWASEQLNGLKETFASLGIEVVAETNANWDDAKQISDLDSIAVLKPDLLVSIPLNGQTTAAAYKRIAEAGTKVVFIDQAVDGMDPGKGLRLDRLVRQPRARHVHRRRTRPRHRRQGRCRGHVLRQRLLRHQPALRGLRRPPDGEVSRREARRRRRPRRPEQGPGGGAGAARPLPNLNGLYGSWSIPAMGAATAAQIAGLSPENFKIVCENFDQIVAANMAGKGFIAGISSQRPYDQGAAEAKVGALALIGETTPPYVVVPPLAVNRENLPASYKTIYRHDLPAEMSAALSN